MGGVCLPFFFWYSGSPLLTQTDGQHQRKIAATLRLDHVIVYNGWGCRCR